MKAEKYLLDYIVNHNITLEQIKKDTGINIGDLADGKEELMADEFIKLCIYLGVDPDDVMNTVV